ncbi:MAG: glycerophosphodiester phosphodiesterase family protein [Bacteroidota bacterium]
MKEVRVRDKHLSGRQSGKAKSFRWLQWGAVLGACLVLYLYNASFLARPLAEEPFLLAHRALGQAFDRTGLTATSCTAASMVPAGHAYLENTLPAMRAAFGYSAAYVEFDIHRTVDDSFAVFHDWTTDCRTDGTGVTREQTMTALRQLDIGFGYTADGGETWPFRGKAQGMMPSMTEVLTTFPVNNFVIDIKSNDPEEGKLLAKRIAALEASYQGELILTGGPLAVAAVQVQHPDLRAVTRSQLKACVIKYFALGWTGYVPAACRQSMLLLPANVAPWMWGWPHRFARRMHNVGTDIALIGPYDGGGFSQGFDDVDALKQLPTDYAGGIWTDRIDLISTALADK